MNIRKVTSLTVFVSFLVLFLTSIVLYLVPQGRIAYWANWRFLGLSKENWSHIHINIGILFICFLVIHIYYNWKSIISYLKDHLKRIKIFTKELNVALLLTVFCTLGTYLGLPPFSTVIEISEYFKEAAIRKYGEPPYGHAERSSLKAFSQKTGIDLRRGLVLLEQAGYTFEHAEQTLLEIAKKNRVSPQQVYLTLAPAIELPFPEEGLPEQPAPGTGKLSIEKFCALYALNADSLVQALKQAGLQAEKDMTLKGLAEVNGMPLHAVYEHIQSVVHN
jgi:hypothetical protein